MVATALDATPSNPALELFQLKGETALVTGGSRGIGAAIAIALAQAGAAVIIAQRDVNNTATRDAIRAAGGSAEVVAADLGDVSDAKEVFGRALDVADVSILVNCGGILRRNDSVDIEVDEWNSVLDVNLNSLFFLSQAAGKHFIPKGRGTIINVASLNSFVGGSRVASYAAAKAAVTSLTKALSNEWSKHNIRVNAIAPGSIATDINTDLRGNPELYANRLSGIPGGRWGEPRDFAGPAVFLASRASQYITGETLIVDGGAMGKGPI
ncbi:uncharacterized protein EHS24_001950 [Apiotrichum porosum]|uniref:Ketoreductase domain-containing protein n=1 Tax=Apiotrichum porosum TaxID=105984 RepID=A0A427XJP9_9TREE|nr:uncharacterized protein EHS24_001950 [Apiotrichum porosum]RSH79022.1 hypothetical protein EHS24_001950 [Apiotrichum porosum]